MTLNEIKNHTQCFSIEQYPELIKFLKSDSRKTVRDYAEILQKKIFNHQQEVMRTEKLKYYENKSFSKGYQLIAGIDEVGRGPLAGPVVSAAVIFPRNINLLDINDSKKLSSKKREKLYHEIKECALDIGIGIVTSDIIDKINIYQATKMSMKAAVNNLKYKPDLLLIDAIRCENIAIEQIPIKKGDLVSISIAAASIIAKVTRDEIMNQYHEKFPNYSFNNNKGYGTKEHRDAIINYGCLDIHRKTFLGKILGRKSNGKTS